MKKILLLASILSSLVITPAWSGFVHISEQITINNAKRFALVIGNNGYRKYNINKAILDAQNMTKALTELDFKVMNAFDVKDTMQFQKVLHDFEKQLDSNSIALIYFAGIGSQYQGKPYLLPIDHDFDDKSSPDKHGISLENMMQTLYTRQTLLNIFILDTQFNRSHASSPDIFSIPVTKNAIIAIATQPGESAYEEEDGGVMTTALLKHIKDPKLTILDLFEAVETEMKARQHVVVSYSLSEPFYFHSDKPAMR